MADPPARPQRLNSEELLELAQEAGRIGFFEWDVQGGHFHLSSRFLSIHGFEGFDGSHDSWLRCIHREDQVRIAALTEAIFTDNQREWQAEFRISPGKDELKWMELRSIASYEKDGRPSYVLGVIVDITERKRAAAALNAFTETLEEAVKERTRQLAAENEARKKAEELLRQAQKMEAVGQLTGGVAHDFNNLLTVVVGGLDMIGRQISALPPSPEVARIARAREMALAGVRRATTLTSRLRRFPVSNRWFRPWTRTGWSPEFVSCYAGRSEGPFLLETVLAAGLWRTEADINQLENAILNLAVNARDAMPNGGKVTIETANCYLGKAYVAALSEPVEEGQYVMIAVADTGLGMDRATVERAFDPFYTTKEVGKGTGLGLSQVYGFVRQSAGHVKIYSELGQGTTVKIYLRRRAVEGEPGLDDIRSDAGVRAIGGEKILVVEDDDALRGYSIEILTELGYEVIEASTGASALEALDRAEIDLLFTDVAMPGGMDGRQLADEATRRRPGLKVLFTTGYTRNAIVHHGRLDAGVHMIGKPFSFDELGAKVRALLDS